MREDAVLVVFFLLFEHTWNEGIEMTRALMPAFSSSGSDCITSETSEPVATMMTSGFSCSTRT